MSSIDAISARALTLAATFALLACGGRPVTGDLAPDGSDKLLASLSFYSGAPTPPLARGLFSSAELGHSFVAVSAEGTIYSRVSSSEWPLARRLDAEDIAPLRQLLAAAEKLDLEDHYQVAATSVANATNLRLGDRNIGITGDPGCCNPTAWQGIVPPEVCALAQHLLELDRGGTPVAPGKVKLQGLVVPEHYVHAEPVPPWPLSTIDLADVIGEQPVVVQQASQVQQLIALFELAGQKEPYTAPVYEQHWVQVAIDVWPVIEAVNP